MRHLILQGADEWRQVSSRYRHVLKLGDMKICACPVSTISSRTWQILRLVNETTDPETTSIRILPFDGGLLDQPLWYRQAVEIVRSERNRHRKEELDKKR